MRQHVSRDQELIAEINRLKRGNAALLEAAKKAIAVTGGSKVWNGETEQFLLMLEKAIAQAEGKS